MIRKIHFSNRQYNFIKTLTTIVLPLIGSLYFAFGYILDWPGIDKVCGVILILTTWFALLIHLNSKYYIMDRPYEGSVIISEAENGKKVFSLELDSDPEDLPSMDSIRFKVNKEE